MPALTEISEAHKLDLAAKVLKSGGAIRLQALGTSMLPSIWPGDVLSIESKGGQNVVPGDIVLVARDGRFFIHRLIAKHGAQWITCGDAIPQNDPPVAEAQVLGKVSTIHRRMRTIVPGLRVTPLVRTLAWIFCRSDLFRSVALRIHSGSCKPTRAQRLLVGS
jgi:hypothetical protein